MLFAVLIFAVILLAIGVYYFTKRMDKEEQQGKEYLPDDGLIYDPVTGRKLTLEEAERGIVIPDDVHARVKSDEEIETFYSGAQKESAYIERSLIQYGATPVNHEEVFYWLEQSVIIQELASFGIQFMYEVAPGQYIGVAHVAYSMPGHQGVAGSEDQLVGFIKGAADAARFSTMDGLETEVLSSGVFLRLPRIITRQDPATLLALIHAS
jgi:hypothetical protein